MQTLRSKFATWARAGTGLAGLVLACAAVLGVSAVHAHDAPHDHAAGPAKKPRPELATGAAFSPQGELWIAGIDGAGRLFVQTSGDLGRSWSPPRTLDTVGERPSADGENRPKIAFGPSGVIVISYTRPLAKPYTGEIRLLRSTDGGASFASPATVHADRQVITHRFESIAFDAQGRLHVAWIDKRDGEAQRRASPSSTYTGAAVYHAVSTDGGASFKADVKLAEHSCECCRIALAPTPEGGIAALWRHVFGVNVRDHAFARLGEADAAGAPVRASFDEWAIDACPHHGPGLAPAGGGGYHAVWFGIQGGEPGVRYGRLDAAGHPLSAARALPDPRAEHADVIAAGARLAVVWRSFDGQRWALRAWLSADDGAHFTLRELAQSADDNDHPRLVRRGERLFVVWRQTQEVQVHELEP